jgi:glucose dehydrogenase
VLQSEVPGEQTSATQPIPSRPAPYAQQGLMEADLIDYTPALKDSALKLAHKCRMGPYFIPASPADGKGANGPAEFECSWYAPGAAGGVNIDGGPAVDPETGMMYVGAQSGLSTIEVMHDPCSEHRYSQPHNSCGLLGALPTPPDYHGDQTGGRGGFNASAPTTIAGVSILKPRELGGITAYDMNTGDKKWWVPNGNRWRDVTPVRDSLGLFNGVTLPKIAALGSQPEVITTKTLVIHGTGRGGGGGRGAGRGGAAAAPTVGPQLYAFDKATGKQVGAVSIPAVNTAVPMTFIHKGKQYIVFATGQGGSTTLTALTLPRK